MIRDAARRHEAPRGRGRPWGWFHRGDDRNTQEAPAPGTRGHSSTRMLFSEDCGSWTRRELCTLGFCHVIRQIALTMLWALPGIRYQLEMKKLQVARGCVLECQLRCCCSVAGGFWRLAASEDLAPRLGNGRRNRKGRHWSSELTARATSRSYLCG